MYKSLFIIYNRLQGEFSDKRVVTGESDMAEKQPDIQKDSLESILIESIHTLVYEKDINTALNCFLETICKYYQAERGYVFEMDGTKQIADNTFEWCAEGIEAEIGRLQGISVDVLTNWMKKFREKGEFYIAVLEEDVPCDRADFEILKTQGISSLMAAPLIRDQEIVGFLGVDNPAEHIGDMALLRSVADFVTADLEKRRLIEELRHVGCTDMLTGLKNRNEYMWKLNELKKKKLHSLGVIFIDMNGLKQMNDTKGHEYGDAMIRKTAECIIKYTSDNAYRIGGDEFIALWEEITREEFDDKVEKLKREFAGIKEYTISMGHILEEGEIDIQQQVKKADASMYEAKQAYYQNRHNDRRKRRE